MIYLRCNLIDYNVFDSICLSLLVSKETGLDRIYEDCTPLVIASAVIDEVQVPYGAVNGLITGYGIYMIYQSKDE